jgi:hypothetical protein
MALRARSSELFPEIPAKQIRLSMSKLSEIVVILPEFFITFFCESDVDAFVQGTLLHFKKSRGKLFL